MDSGIEFNWLLSKFNVFKEEKFPIDSGIGFSWLFAKFKCEVQSS